MAASPLPNPALRAAARAYEPRTRAASAPGRQPPVRRRSRGAEQQEPAPVPVGATGHRTQRPLAPMIPDRAAVPALFPLPPSPSSKSKSKYSGVERRAESGEGRAARLCMNLYTHSTTPPLSFPRCALFRVPRATPRDPGPGNHRGGAGSPRTRFFFVKAPWCISEGTETEHSS
jgi:hypothetical protein